jgi:alginate O-acetyltransferase complex protein AlgI
MMAILQPIFWLPLFVVCAAVCTSVRSRNVRQAVLLIASYAFYFQWGIWFAVVLFASTAMNFFLGTWLRRKNSWPILTVGIVLNIALLSTFKYLPEAAVTLPFSSLQRFAHLALPLGISFWTFQAMSYLFDLYRGEELDPSLVEFALYMAFFPVVISGPICRMPEMLPQFRSETTTCWDDMGSGLRRIATGVFMMQVARLLGQGILGGDGINSGFDRASRWSGADAWCLAIGFGLQLFFDFAGYSHIAIGAAKMLGYTIPENFARPFQSTTVSIFWTRWHMSLSFWIRDNVFLPLAILRREIWWRSLVLIVSMVMFGLWHKASVLFLLWGFYHGVLLMLHRQVQSVQRKFGWQPPVKAWVALSWITTMAFVSLGWIFFRAGSVPQAGQMLSAILSPSAYAAHYLSLSLYMLVAAITLGYIAVLSIGAILDRYAADGEATTVGLHSGTLALLAAWRWFWIPSIYALALLFVLLITHGQGDGVAQLMYRNF